MKVKEQLCGMIQMSICNSNQVVQMQNVPHTQLIMVVMYVTDVSSFNCVVSLV